LRSGDLSAVACLVVTLATVAVMLFYVGSPGAERLFFQRHLEGKPVSLPHLLRLVKAFVGRFFKLGVLFGIVFIAYFFALASGLGIDIAHLPDTGAQCPLSFQVSFAALAIAIDFARTFVTPALAYTTCSVLRAWDSG